jgi:RNA-directed DNA polymerase
MENPKRARSGKPWIQPRGGTCVDPSGLQSALERIRQAASRDKKLRFTGLWHHVYRVDRLREAYYSLKKGAAPGMDGETWRHYGEDLEANLQDLS